MADGFYRL